MFFLIGLTVGVLITLNKDKISVKVKELIEKIKNKIKG